MQIFFYFKACRLCLKESSKVHLTSMFDGKGEKAKTLENVGRIDVSLRLFNCSLLLIPIDSTDV